MSSLNVGFLGCGYVAGFYVNTMGNHDNINPYSVFDVDIERGYKFSEFHNCVFKESLEEFLSDPKLDIVLNLTPPECHMETTLKALKNGKNVYSEKPLAMGYLDAKFLYEIAEKNRVLLSSAPCSIMGEAAQGLFTGIQEGVIGHPFLVYAELDDGPIYRMDYKSWISELGVNWPIDNEMKHGCVKEHALYPISWLTTFFGPAKRVVGSTYNLFPDKLLERGYSTSSPDFSSYLIEFDGTVARLTIGTLAKRNREFSVYGTAGELHVEDCWNFGSPIGFNDQYPPNSKILKTKLKYTSVHKCGDSNDMDYCRGLSDLSSSILNATETYISKDQILHMMELVEFIDMMNGDNVFLPKTTFVQPKPMMATSFFHL